MRFLLLSLLSLCLFAAPALAQGEAVPSSVPGTGALEDLVKTLESDTARKELVDQIKALIEVQKNGEGEGETGQDGEDTQKPSDLLGIDKLTGAVSSSYEGMLEGLNISSGLFQQILLSGGAILVAALLAFGFKHLSLFFWRLLEKLKDRFRLSHDRFSGYMRVLRWIAYFLITITLIYTLTDIWNFKPAGIDLGDWLLSTVKFVVKLSLMLALVAALWEALNGAIEFAVAKVDQGHASTRLNTILPVVRNILFSVIFVLFVLVALSEFGIDIVPLLAGAGVLGIAVGFGAQTMVKDFLTGFIILLEDLVHIGDVATVGGKTGIVERITMRKMQLRDYDGRVYTVPFSEITIVENWTKIFSQYVFNVGVAYRENTDDVINVMREVDEELRADEDFKDKILDPLDIAGVDGFADSAIIIKARYKTQPIQQWAVGREYNRRLKLAFDKHGIEIPFPYRTLVFGEEKDGSAAAARIIMEEAQKRQTQESGQNEGGAEDQGKGDRAE